MGLPLGLSHLTARPLTSTHALPLITLLDRFPVETKTSFYKKNVEVLPELRLKLLVVLSKSIFEGEFGSKFEFLVRVF